MSSHPPNGRELRRRPPSGVDPSGAWELLQLLRDGRARTRTQIATELNLSRSTVTSRLEALSAAGLVRPAGGEPSTGGRPPSTLSFNQEARLILAVHITPERTRMALTDLGGRVHARHEARHRPDQSPEQVLAWVTLRARKMLSGLGRRPEDLGGIGVGLPADIDQNSSRPVHSATMPEWEHVDIAGALRRSFTVPVKIVNEIHLLAINEHLTRWQDHTDLLYVHLDGPPKAAIISGGVLQPGSSGTAGTLTGGHPHVDGLSWPSTASQGSAGTRETGRRLGEILAVAVSILNPSAIIIGGQGLEAGEHLIAGVRETVLHRSPPSATLGLSISLGAGNDHSALEGISRILGPEILTRKCLSAILCAQPG